MAGAIQRVSSEKSHAQVSNLSRSKCVVGGWFRICSFRGASVSFVEFGWYCCAQSWCRMNESAMREENGGTNYLPSGKEAHTYRTFIHNCPALVYEFQKRKVTHNKHLHVYSKFRKKRLTDQNRRTATNFTNIKPKS